MAVLIIEDDRRVSAALSAFLRKVGYSTVQAENGREALELLSPETEVILLDLGLPDIDGIDLCREIRAQSGAPIIIATARTEVRDRIVGLRAGADDYVVKPYDVRELVARIEAVTRRNQGTIAETSESVVQIGNVYLDLVGREVTVLGQLIDLTRTEFDIVAVLARHPGVALPRERIIREVWNSDWHAFSRSLEVHVGSIRRKIGEETPIETVRGVGYRLKAA